MTWIKLLMAYSCLPNFVGTTMSGNGVEVDQMGSKNRLTSQLEGLPNNIVRLRYDNYLCQ